MEVELKFNAWKQCGVIPPEVGVGFTVNWWIKLYKMEIELTTVCKNSVVGFPSRTELNFGEFWVTQHNTTMFRDLAVNLCNASDNFFSFSKEQV